MAHPTEEMVTPPRQRRHPIARRITLISMVLLVALVATLIFIYQRAAAELDAQLKFAEAASDNAVAIFSITAASAMSYDEIIEFISSYGMRLNSSPCTPYSIYEPQSRSQEQYWSLKNPFLFLTTTTLAPPDWKARLRTLPIIESIDTRLPCDGQGIYQQERSWSGWWRKMTNPLFSPLRNPSPIKLRSSDPTMSYKHAVRRAFEMGFRLADPTYEAAQVSGESPLWHPVSQADMFATQRTLLVAPTLDTPRDWKGQVEATHQFSVET